MHPRLQQPPGTQIQYRSYLHPITIYHVSLTTTSLTQIFNHLKDARIAFLRTTLSPDPLFNTKPNPGDEVPSHSMETIYLPKCLTKGGSALGFRLSTQAGRERVDCIEWLCFSTGVAGLLEAMQWGGEMVFDRAAVLERCDKPVKGTVAGCKEHREFFEALAQGRVRGCRVRLTWVGRYREYEAEVNEQARRVGKLAGRLVQGEVMRPVMVGEDECEAKEGEMMVKAVGNVRVLWETSVWTAEPEVGVPNPIKLEYEDEDQREIAGEDEGLQEEEEIGYGYESDCLEDSPLLLKMGDSENETADHEDPDVEMWISVTNSPTGLRRPLCRCHSRINGPSLYKRH